MKILVLGDSHSRYLNVTQEMRDFIPNSRGVDLKVISISAASIKGFGRRESTLSTYDKFLQEYYDYKPDLICFALGQVDLELGYFYSKVIKGNNLSSKSFINEVITLYLDKLSELVKELNIEKEKVIIKGVNLSTLTESRSKAINYTSKIIVENIHDVNESKRYKELLKDNFPCNSIRNNHHNYFNLLLGERCKKLGFCYFDINDSIVDVATKNVKKEFIPSTNDHHLVDSLFVREVHLQRLLNAINI